MGQRGGQSPGGRDGERAHKSMGCRQEGACVVAVSEKRRWLWGRGGRGDRSRIVKGFNELCPMYSKGA